MKTIRIKNLRSLEDTGEINIKPITILLGINSSGKSSFLRTFPLLKQSAESRTVSPLLWYGPLVDFGSFQDVLRRGAGQEYISFRFVFTIKTRDMFYRRKGWIEIDQKKHKVIEVAVTIVLEQSSKQEISRPREVVLEFLGHQANFQFKSSGKVVLTRINDTDFTENSFDGFRWFQRYGILPSIERGPTRSFDRYTNIPNPYLDELVTTLKSFVRKNTSEDRIRALVRSVEVGTSPEMLQMFQEIKSAPKSFLHEASTWDVQNKKFQRVRDLILATYVQSIYDACEDYLLSYARNVYYMAPIRASAERYYRLQGLAINEVDFQGQNLAIFLRNLPAGQKDRYHQWMRYNFGLIPEIQLEGGHITLKLRDTNTDELFNLADMGFGYSQLLPVITQIWTNLNRNRYLPSFRRNIPMTFAIEQPELHLHPRLQAKLADIFASFISTPKRNVQPLIILETHSETLVNRFGHLIVTGKLDHNDVNVVIFEKEPTELVTKVYESGYDKDGYLTNWPIGFFDI